MTPEEHAQMVELAGMKSQCVFCRGTGYTHEPFAGRGQGGQNDPDGKYTCEGCHGTGEVYLLDAGVRVPCCPEVCIKGTVVVDDLPWGRMGDSHDVCAGRGWTPSQDLAAWWNALYVAGYNLELTASVNTPSLNGAHVYRPSGEVNLAAEAVLTAPART